MKPIINENVRFCKTIVKLHDTASELLILLTIYLLDAFHMAFTLETKTPYNIIIAHTARNQMKMD